LFLVYNLTGFINGTKACPIKTHQNFNYWIGQDRLIFQAIITTVYPSITTLGSMKTSQQAWEIIQKMYLFYQDSWTHHLLKERISRFTKEACPITENLTKVKAIVDELSINNSPLDDINLVIHTLNGLGTKYHEIITAIRTWENPIRVMGYLKIFRSRPFNVWMTRLISSAITFTFMISVIEMAPLVNLESLSLNCMMHATLLLANMFWMTSHPSWDVFTLRKAMIMLGSTKLIIACKIVDLA